MNEQRGEARGISKPEKKRIEHDREEQSNGPERPTEGGFCRRAARNWEEERLPLG